MIGTILLWILAFLMAWPVGVGGVAGIYFSYRDEHKTYQRGVNDVRPRR